VGDRVGVRGVAAVAPAAPSSAARSPRASRRTHRSTPCVAPPVPVPGDEVFNELTAQEHQNQPEVALAGGR
jgi:hypothetical protein